jgi:tRNA threonylcarbamoyladenosine biosynthesis protein TsaB
MKILAIDTSTEICSAALLVGEEAIHRCEYASRQHARTILPMISTLLSEAQLSLAQLDAMALSAGPGSFTGIRIATGVVQGLAYAVDLPVISISTLAIIAQAAYTKFTATDILPALDARMQQVYWGIYHIDQDKLARPVIADNVADPQEVFVPETGSNWIGVGSGWGEYGCILQKQLGQRLWQVYPDCFPEAQYALPLAAKRFATGKFIAAEKVVPIYLREKVV